MCSQSRANRLLQVRSLHVCIRVWIGLQIRFRFGNFWQILINSCVCVHRARERYCYCCYCMRHSMHCIDFYDFYISGNKENKHCEYKQGLFVNSFFFGWLVGSKFRSLSLSLSLLLSDLLSVCTCHFCNRILSICKEKPRIRIFKLYLVYIILLQCKWACISDSFWSFNTQFTHFVWTTCAKINFCAIICCCYFHAATTTKCSTRRRKATRAA